jgi:hypothetical protein
MPLGSNDRSVPLKGADDKMKEKTKERYKDIKKQIKKSARSYRKVFIRSTYMKLSLKNSLVFQGTGCRGNRIY